MKAHKKVMWEIFQKKWFATGLILWNIYCCPLWKLLIRSMKKWSGGKKKILYPPRSF